MTKKPTQHSDDVDGITRLAVAATVGLTDLAEALHHTVTRTPGTRSTPTPDTVQQLYESIRNITTLGGEETKALLAPLLTLLGEPHPSLEQDTIRAVLNGVMGDYLAAHDNPLTIPMQLRYHRQPLDLSPTALTAAFPQAQNTILLLVHGLCLTDQHWQWQNHNHGALLATDLGATPIYLHYNTGLHISTNGHMLANMLETLHHKWPVPVENVVIIGHSMGGLVARSACHYGELAEHAWLRCLRQMISLSTPHHGAPLERYAREVQRLLGDYPYTAPLAQLGTLRSDGITDLGYGNLVDEDWSTHDRSAPMSDQRQSVLLPHGVACYTIGATTGPTAGDLRNQLLGDGLVPLQSALGIHQEPQRTIAFPDEHQWIGYEMHHMDVLYRREVYTQMRHWLVGP
ncbi:MAG: Triacylglycerol esterase/lipase EstA, alpha/beta hydrolase fold [Chloroflexi bacterium AL-W]|nr:Triacylglycerol esterase/lipase EstA, alpha/beta hydrolase fold [Chloroflexi bacterium AL-N1]NOK66552.1 Triacylglycerol esterase/lipase EstA, alpha/beta hydrolase fold [Chloroflexi bacterium AL-N10]NOK71940.1 Triacylglycerol esterase/lipase EstA, alpha/beta hydrolase fold [Chloroflexi bacterium AL-N5]NOK81197.1 Triacylglycerol esterase/lipase EstA, alpha/beta hydrolase fold [Chloroflexi bacterium AL-W]NOK89470.1 Triacylglycerol esterase/lipase EstA, alpha/beta hydrolase fold [Chloroflexi bac